MNKQKIYAIMSIILLIVINIAVADNLFPIYVRNRPPNTIIELEINYTTDAGCSNILFSDVQNVAIDNKGVGFMLSNITTLTTTPSFICEYQDNVLVNIHQWNDIFLAGKQIIFNDVSIDNLQTGSLKIDGTVNIVVDDKIVAGDGLSALLAFAGDGFGGGEGGGIDLRGGSGSNGTGTGGQGGAITLTSGEAGDGTSFLNGGVGGFLNLNSGDGGDGVIGGKGGDVRIESGDGGEAIESSNDGDGGDIFLTSGNAGTSGSELNSHQGDVYIQSQNTLIGNSGVPNAKLHIIGDVGVSDSNNPHAIDVLNILGGAGANLNDGGDGADGSIIMGNGGSGINLGNSGGVGGELILTGGIGGLGTVGANGGVGGNILITGGKGGGGAGTAGGGNVIISGGLQSQGVGEAGIVKIISQDALGGDNSGNIELTTGKGGATKDSGNIIIKIGGAGVAGGGKGIIKVDGNLNQTSGNTTVNMIYGEMWFHNDSSGGVQTIIPASMTWVNITGFNQSSESGQTLNGFSYDNPNELLTVLVAGLYKIDYSISFERASGGASREFKTTVAINNIIQDNTETHRATANVNDVGNTGGTGFLNLVVNDEIQLQIINQGGSENAGVHAANINLFRIGS